MVKSKTKKRDQVKLTLSTKFGKKTANEILARRKLQISKFDRATSGLEAGEISNLEKGQQKRTHKGRKVLAQQSAKRKEDPKQALFVKGSKCNVELQRVLERLCNNRLPNAVRDTAKNKVDLHPFEDPAYMMNMMNSKNSHLMVMGSSSKKRPANITLSRKYGDSLLDMTEFNVTDIKDHGISAVSNASKALVITQGALWHGRYEMDAIRSMLVDLFYGYVPDKVFVTGVERLVVLSAVPNKSGDITDVPTICVNQYKICYKASDSKTSDASTVALPMVDLVPIDHEFKLSLDRIKVAEERMMKDALRVPREEHTAKSQSIKEKGLEKDEYGNIMGRVHFMNEFTDLDKLKNKNSHASRTLERPIPSKKKTE